MLSKGNRKYAFMAGGVALLAIVVYVISTRIIKVPLTSVTPPPALGGLIALPIFQMTLSPTKALDVSKWPNKTVYISTKSLGNFKAKVQAAAVSSDGKSIMVSAGGPYPADATSGAPVPYSNTAGDSARIWLF